MTGADLAVLLPLLLPAGSVVLVMLSMSVRRDPQLALALAVFGLLAGIASIPLTAGFGDRYATSLLVVDGWSRFYWGVILVAALGVAPMAHAWCVDRQEPSDEVQILVLLAAVGAGLLAAAAHFGSVILGLETLSVALYALVTGARTRRLGVEAGMKYFLLAAGSSAWLMFGLALCYAATGAMTLEGFAAAWPRAEPAVLVRAGALLALIGIGFKLALVPFHLWAPDVYQGAPSPIAALVATVSKAGVMALLARWALGTPLRDAPGFVLALAVMSGASMVVGNLLALQQDNVKRLLAYSSIAHLGYALVAVVAGGPRAAGLYVAAYAVTVLGAFGVVALLSSGPEEIEDLADYRGLFWRHPLVALALTPILLSLAGIPLTAGFMGKLYVMQAGTWATRWMLLALLIVGSVLGLYYYLRVVATMFTTADDARRLEPSGSIAAWAPVVVATALVVLVGVWSTPWVAWMP